MKKLLLYFLVSGLGILFTVANLLSQTKINLKSSNDSHINTLKPNEDSLNELLNKSAELLFTEHIIVNNLDGPNTMAAADFDADGDVDFVATSFDGNYISWLENDGNQNFTEHRLIENFGQPRLDIAYIDDDLDFDIIAGSQSGDKISWFENDGQANFTEHLIIENWESAGVVYVRDQQRGIDLEPIALEEYCTREFVSVETPAFVRNSDIDFLGFYIPLSVLYALSRSHYFLHLKNSRCICQ